jgi:predicted permease
VPEPDRLMQVNRMGPGGAGPVLSYPVYRGLRDATGDVADLLVTSRVWRWNIRVGQAPAERVAGELVSRNYFETLRVAPSLGRLLSSPLVPSPQLSLRTPGGAVDDNALLVVLSHAFWTRRFGADPQVLGAVLAINGTPVTIVGVAERRFTGVEIADPVDMWAPLELQPRLLNGPSWLEQPGNNWLRAVGRLKPNATPERLRAVAHATFRHDLEARGLQNEERIVVADGSHGLSGLHARIARPMAFLALLVGIVLLTACVNVATLHLGRAAHRQRELAVRLALGSGRARLVRQLITENLLLSGIGAACGLFLAWVSRDALMALLFPLTDRPPLEVALDARVLAFTAMLGVMTGVLSGILPARLAWRLDVNDGLVRLGARTTDRIAPLAGFVLPAAQVALTFVLLVGAGLFARSLQSLRALDPGFDGAQVLAARLDAQSMPYAPAAFANLYRQLLDGGAALPGVRRAALADQALFTHAVRQRNVTVDGFAPRAEADLNPYVLGVSPGFFETMGIGVVGGRDFDATDLTERAGGVALVNRSFARYYFGDGPVVGRRFGFGGQGVARDVTIIGVVEDAKYSDLRQAAPHLVYTALGPDNFPTRSFSFSETTLILRTDGDAAGLAATLRRTLATVDPGLTVIGIATLEQHVDRSLGQDRLVSVLSALFGALALALTCTGIYGVLSYSVTRRVREIGVRLALGARPAQIRWMVARRGLLVLGAGLLVGLPAALGAGQLVARLLFHVSKADPVTLIGALLILTVVTLLAAFGPARAAARVDPIEALRGE